MGLISHEHILEQNRYNKNFHSISFGPVDHKFYRNQEEIGECEKKFSVNKKGIVSIKMDKAKSEAEFIVTNH